MRTLQDQKVPDSRPIRSKSPAVLLVMTALVSLRGPSQNVVRGRDLWQFDDLMSVIQIGR
jgi:hypothetical protein